MKIDFDKGLNQALYYLHNRHHDGQVVLLWKSGPHFAFTFHDEKPVLPAGRDWHCIGELEWNVVGDHFVHELRPLQHRSTEELQERALRAQRHRAYRQRLWQSYSLNEQLNDL